MNPATKEPWWPWLLECFVASNLAFLALDIYVAHSVNAFSHRMEWVPLVFSILAPLCLAPAWSSRKGFKSPAGRSAGFVVGGLSVLVGFAGLYYHLHDTFFIEHTFKNLVYTAPFAAPLAYAGLGMLLCLNRMESSQDAAWGSWVIVLAAGGFVGNFVLTLADHAQNGFFVKAEWISVGAAALGVGFLGVAGFARSLSTPMLWLCLGVMALEVLIGLLGFGLHIAGNLGSPEKGLWRQMIFGAPVFAPLLFVDLAALACLGLLQRSLHQREQSPSL